MIFKILLPPILGGIIGYITNAIAIKMLFHPRKPIYIGKWRLPLTPGLIPKEKHRVAQSIGKVISEQLLDCDTLQKVFTSEELLKKMRDGLYHIIRKIWKLERKDGWLYINQNIVLFCYNPMDDVKFYKAFKNIKEGKSSWWM